MSDSLGDELCKFLQTKSVGNFNGAGTKTLFSTMLVDQPDQQVAVIERGGQPPIMWLTGGQASNPNSQQESRFDRANVQIRTRSGMDGYVAGYALVMLVYKSLHGVTETTLNAGGSLFHLIQAHQNPVYLGRDGRQRHEWSQNFSVWWENPFRA